MIYVSFKNKEIYKNMKYSCCHRLMYKNDTHIAVELEYIDVDSNWHLQMPFEDDLKELEERLKITDDEYQKEKIKERLSHWSKYRKWQKRKLYTIEEFKELFEPLK